MRRRVLLSLLAIFCVETCQSDDLSQWTLDDKIGQLFVVGYRSDIQLEELRPGAVVLFSWNMKNVEGVKALTTRLGRFSREKFRAPLLIGVDHEGGQVLRLRKGLTEFPDAAVMGATEDPQLAYRVGEAMGQELSALGIHMNFAPVLDLGNARSFLKNRIWGDDGQKVAEMTMSFIRGLEDNHILAVPKHFPGHGRSTRDSHFFLPKLHLSPQELWKQDLEPFRQATRQGVEAVMTAHVEIPSLDIYPASISQVFLSEVLRKRIGFQGLVITDDLEMGGVKSWGAPGDIALRALKAGSDMVLMVWSQEVQREVQRRLRRAVQNGEFSESLLDEKVQRILSLKNRYLPAEKSDFEEDWRQRLRRPASLQLVKTLHERAIERSGRKYLTAVRAFQESWRQSWRVWLPSRREMREWRRWREQDQISILPRRPDSEHLKSFQQLWEGDLDRQASHQPMVVMTSPRASASDEVFQVIRESLSERWNQPTSNRALLWVHQGSLPVEIRRAPKNERWGLMGLYSSSREGVATFLSFLQSGGSSSSFSPQGAL